MKGVSSRFNATSSTNRVYGYGRCVMWLDAKDTSTLTLSGSNVTEWKDKSSKGTLMKPAQSGATATGSPTYSSTEKAVVFTNTSSGLSSATQGLQAASQITIPSPSLPRTCYMVFKLTNAAMSGFNAILRISTSERFTCLHFTTSTSSANKYTQESGSGTALFTGFVVTYTPNITSNTMYVATSTMNPSTGSYVYLNGSLGGSNTANLFTPNTSQNAAYTTSQLSVGGGYDNRSWDGNLYEMLWYNEYHSATVRRDIESKLAARWSVTGYV